MDFLEDYGFDESVINAIIDNNTEENIYNFIENEMNVRTIIEFLQKHKVENIDRLFISNISYFLCDLEMFKKRFNITV